WVGRVPRVDVRTDGPPGALVGRQLPRLDHGGYRGIRMIMGRIITQPHEPSVGFTQAFPSVEVVPYLSECHSSEMGNGRIEILFVLLLLLIETREIVLIALWFRHAQPLVRLGLEFFGLLLVDAGGIEFVIGELLLDQLYFRAGGWIPLPEPRQHIAVAVRLL